MECYISLYRYVFAISYRVLIRMEKKFEDWLDVVLFNSEFGLSLMLQKDIKLKIINEIKQTRKDQKIYYLIQEFDDNSLHIVDDEEYYNEEKERIPEQRIRRFVEID